MGSLDTGLPLQGAPHQALCRAKAQAANVLNSAKGSLREGPTQGSGEPGCNATAQGLRALKQGCKDNSLLLRAALQLLPLRHPGMAPNGNKKIQAAAFLLVEYLQACGTPRNPQSTANSKGQAYRPTDRLSQLAARHGGTKCDGRGSPLRPAHLQSTQQPARAVRKWEPLLKPHPQTTPRECHG